MRLALFLALAAALCVGCSSATEEPKGYEKDAFKKSGPPPEYRGPGQPGGPGSGPIAGPGETKTTG